MLNTMNMKIHNTKEWLFPESIKFESVADYMQHFEQVDTSAHITFDLSDTTTIHSSFIGFLIHVKHMTQQNGGKLSLVLSFTAERILIMLNILDYFAPEISTLINRKTA